MCTRVDSSSYCGGCDGDTESQDRNTTLGTTPVAIRDVHAFFRSGLRAGLHTIGCNTDSSNNTSTVRNGYGTLNMPDSVFTVIHDSSYSCSAASELDCSSDTSYCADDCTEFSCSASVWRIDVDATLPQPQDRALRFLEQDTFDADCALNAVVDIVSQAHGPFLCLYQHKEWWMRPAWCESLGDVPERTQLILWRNGEQWAALVAVSGNDARADFHGEVDLNTAQAANKVANKATHTTVNKPANNNAEEHSALHLTIASNRAGRTSLTDAAAYYALASSPYAAIQSCVTAAAQHLGIAPRNKRPLPEALSGFGWCTWDSLARDVSEKAIIEKMDEFQAKGIPVSWVMVDDGWSQLDREAETLLGFGADPERFPKGLAHTVDLLRNRYGVQHVGVWQAFQGYWNGLEPHGSAADQARDYLITTSNGCLIPGADKQRASSFWATWQSQLRKDGIDCVKVDSQSSTSVMMRGIESYGESTIGRHTALDAVVDSEFDGALINCMGMAPEDYWHRPTSPITRTSDDFIPHDPSSLAEHLMQNAYCSLLMNGLYHCDWDMFWSQHSHAQTHAVMRALSGGPVYCSDAAGASEPDILMPLVLRDGRVLRPDSPAVPTPDCLLTDPTRSETAWCVQTHCGAWRVLVFVGLQENAVQHGTIVAKANVDAGLWVVDGYAHTAQYVQADEALTCDLAYGQSRLFYVWDSSECTPLVGKSEGGHAEHTSTGSVNAAGYAAAGSANFPADSASDSASEAFTSLAATVIPIGLVDKYLAPAGITSCRIDGDDLIVELAEPGVFAFLDPGNQCGSVMCNGEALDVTHCGAMCTVQCVEHVVTLHIG